MSSEPTLAPGTVVAGKLRIVRVLGAGGMGAVYEVEHEFTKHRRALKLLHAEMLAHPTIVARFLREASAAGHIGNPHIVETFDAGRLESGEPYLVMELLEGETLADRIAKDPQPPLREIIDVVGQACDGVEAAHTAGIVHRDLKPENIFLVQREGKTFVKILDFGISKFDPVLTGGAGVTRDGATIGTPFYMSPEQVNGDADIDARTDIYALGVILYECTSGKKPFEADLLPKLSVLIHAGKAARLSELRGDLPEGFVATVHKAMARERDERFASARELAHALSKFGGAALDRTVPDPTGPSLTPPPERPSARPSSLPAGDSVRPRASARTLAASSLSVAAEKTDAKQPRRGVTAVALLLGLGVVALGAFAVTLAMRTSSSPAAVGEPPASGTTGPAEGAAQRAGARDTRGLALPPLDTPDAAASGVAVTPPAPTTTGRAILAPPPTAATAPPALPPVTTAKPPGTTRADQHGLSTTNPYASPSHP